MASSYVPIYLQQMEIVPTDNFVHIRTRHNSNGTVNAAQNVVYFNLMKNKNLPVVLFLWRAAFCSFSVKQRAAFQLSLTST
jgi:hypothetical protein